MPSTIRSRLQLLMMTVLLPAMAAALVVVARTYQGERDAVERSLRDSARAIAQVVDSELARRADMARVIASSRLLSETSEGGLDLVWMHAWSSHVIKELGGWIELRSAGQVLVDTRLPAGSPPRPLAADELPLSQVPVVRPLTVAPSGTLRPPQVVQPVRQSGGPLLNLVIVVPVEVLQRLIDHQNLPANWVGTVVDDGQRVVARHPGGAAYLGRLSTPDMRERLSRDSQGLFSSATLDGAPALGYFSKTSHGWAYMTAAPRDATMGDVPWAVLQVVAGALLLLAAAAAAAMWMGRGITQAAESLEGAAQALQAGALVLQPLRTGIAEFDEVGRTLEGAALALANARRDMERQVAEAVARTRLAEQRASQGQRITALGRLTGGVAHDFNNLLGVISNSAHLIERHVAHLPALQMPVAVTQRAVEMGSHLSQQLLRVGGRQPVSPRPVDLASYLPELRELLQMVMRKNIPVRIDVQPGIDLVKIDAGELELALINLALNARDAMPNGGVLRVQARMAAADEAEGLPTGRYVLVAVSDNGKGMDEQLAEQVFEPFFTTKAVGQGTGLGLSQVHGFCVQAGGTARMASTPGLGSTVTLVLPACETKQALALPPMPGATEEVQTALAGTRLLLVEDNDELADVTVMLLQFYGCVVTRASHVEDALARIGDDDSLQLVLTDVVMPGPRNGVDLARELARTRPLLPVVLISGYSTALAGLTGFHVLRKPVAADLLVHTLVAALRGVRPPGPSGDA